MGIRGKGNPGGNVIKPGTILEDSLNNLMTELPGSEIDGRHFRADQRKLTNAAKAAAGAIDPKGAIRNATPAQRTAAMESLDALQDVGLGREDPLLHAVFEDAKLQQTGLSDETFWALLLLAGDRLSANEQWAIMQVGQRTPLSETQGQQLLEAVSKTQAAQAVPEKVEELRQAVPVWGPFVAPMLLWPVLGPLGAPAEAIRALTTTGVSAGVTWGQYAQSNFPSKADFGVNRLEYKPKTDVDHDLVRLYDRAIALSATTPPERLRSEAGLIDLIVGSTNRHPPIAGLRQRSGWATNADGEKAIVELRKFATDLRTISGGSAEDLGPRLAAAQARLRENVDRAALKQVPALPVPALPDTAKAKLGEVALAYVDEILNRTNPAFGGLMVRIRQQYGLDAATPPAPGAKLSKETIANLLGMANTNLTTWETMALLRLEKAGLIDRKDFAPRAKGLPEDARYDLDTLRTMLDGLGGRERGEFWQGVAKNVGRLSPWVAAGVMVVLTLVAGVAAPLALLLTFAVRMGGAFGSMFLHKKAQEDKVRANVDMIGGRPLESEASATFERIADPKKMLSAPPGQLGQHLLQEASSLEALAQLMISTLQLSPDRERLDLLPLIQGPLWMKVREFAGSLKSISGLENEGEMRKQYLDLRAQLVGPSGMTGAILESVFLSQSYPEFNNEFIAYVANVNAFRNQAKSLLDAMPGAPQRSDLLTLAERVKEAWKHLPKDAKNELTQRLKDQGGDVAHVLRELELTLRDITIEKTGPVPDRAALEHMVARLGQLLDTISNAASDLAGVSQKRATEISQEVITLYWSQALRLLGSVSKDQASNAPRVQKPVATFKDQKWTVEAGLDQGGRFSVTMGINGMPDLASIDIDFGEKRLAQMALEVTKSRLEVLSNGPAPRLSAELLKHDADAGTYEFRVNGAPTAYTVKLDGAGCVLAAPREAV